MACGFCGRHWFWDVLGIILCHIFWLKQREFSGVNALPVGFASVHVAMLFRRPGFVAGAVIERLRFPCSWHVQGMVLSSRPSPLHFMSMWRIARDACSSNVDILSQ